MVFMMEMAMKPCFELAEKSGTPLLPIMLALESSVLGRGGI